MDAISLSNRGADFSNIIDEISVGRCEEQSVTTDERTYLSSADMTELKEQALIRAKRRRGVVATAGREAGLLVGMKSLSVATRCRILATCTPTASMVGVVRVVFDNPGSAVRFAKKQLRAYCGHLPHRY